MNPEKNNVMINFELARSEIEFEILDCLTNVLFHSWHVMSFLFCNLSFLIQYDMP